MFREVASLGKELKRLAPVLGARTPAKAAIVFDWESRWQMLTQAAAEPRGRVLTLTQNGRLLTLETDADVVWNVTEATELYRPWDTPQENFRVVWFERKVEADGVMKHAVSIR